MKNNEPTLETIEDYNTLKGSKKRVVWIVIIIGLIIGAIFVAANNYSEKSNDTIPVQDTIANMPVK
ncbi:MAG TPA: hypothetical protein VFX68_00725 [Sulfuricurvum sp.]|nr:hypothetical protein [Sulfuricurvum sp.]